MLIHVVQERDRRQPATTGFMYTVHLYSDQSEASIVYWPIRGQYSHLWLGEVRRSGCCSKVTKAVPT